MNSIDKLVKLVKPLKLLRKVLLFPVALGLLAPAAVDAAGGDHSGHYDQHSPHGHSGEASPSTMLMGKTTFVVGGVDGVTSMATAKDETTLI